MFKKIIKNTVIYGLAPYVASFANLLVLPIITKDLSEIDYGISGTIYAYTGALSAFSNLGLTIILTNSFFQYPQRFKWIWRQIYGFLTLWYVVFAIVVVVVLALLMPESVGHNKNIIIFLNTLPIVLFGPTSTIAVLYYTLKKQATQIGYRTAIFGLLAVFLNLYFISKLKLGYLGWFWTTFIVGILTNFSYWYPLNRINKITPIIKFKKTTIKKALKISIPIIPNHYSYYLLDGSDRLIMDRLHASTANIGEYNMASTFSNYTGSLATASSNAIVPYLIEMLKNKDYHKARNLLYLWSSAFICITFFICLWSREIFDFLIKNDVLKQTYPLAIIMIMAYNFRPIFIGAYQYMVFKEKTKAIWKVPLYAGLFSISINLALIPLWGFKVAVYTLFCAFMFWGIALYFSKPYKEIKVLEHHPIKWTLIVIALTVIVYILKNAALPIKLLITTVGILSIMIIILLLRHIIKTQSKGSILPPYSI